MQNKAYMSFLRHLPQSLQDGLAIKTLGGTENLRNCHDLADRP